MLTECSYLFFFLKNHDIIFQDVLFDFICLDDNVYLP